jgi:hypothetical protein
LQEDAVPDTLPSLATVLIIVAMMLATKTFAPRSGQDALRPVLAESSRPSATARN